MEPAASTVIVGERFHSPTDSSRRGNHFQRLPYKINVNKENCHASSEDEGVQSRDKRRAQSIRISDSQD